MHNRIRTIASFFFLLLIISTGTLFAQEGLTGLQVMQKVYNRPIPEDQQDTMIMTLKNSRGSRRVRNISQYSKTYESDSKKIMFFTSPADVRGTSFMSFSYEDEEKQDDQWIYLPALKKVKRISSSSSNNSFMGSDFTYDDIGDRHPSEDTHRIISEEKFNGQKCIVVESIPKDPDSAYSRTLSWIVPDKWFGLKKEFYDPEGVLLKTLIIKDYKQIDGYWMLVELEMYNSQKEHSTLIELQDLKLNTNIDDRLFTTRTMIKGVH